MSVDYSERIGALIAELRARDTDPRYATRPRLHTYARISKNEEGEGKGDRFDKTDRQTFDILSAMVRDGYRLGRILRDDNMSAWKPRGKRTAWRELITDIEAKRIDGVYVWHVDRLTRRPMDLELLVDKREAGMVVASCYGRYDISDPDQLFMIRLQINFAAKSSDDTSRRSRRVFRERREAGKSYRRDAFGFDGAVSDEVRAQERAAILAAIEGLVSGSASWQGIARTWNDAGLVSRRGGDAFNVSRVRTVLLNPRNAGLIVYGAQTYVCVDEEPIVSRELWTRFEAMLSTRAIGRPRDKAGYPLSGLVRCAVCGRQMTGSTVKHRSRVTDELVSYRAYRCVRETDHKNAISAELAETWARTEAMRLIDRPENAYRIARLSVVDTDLTAKLVVLRERRARAIASFTKLNLDPAEIEATLGTLTAQIDEHEKSLALVRDNLTDIHAVDRIGSELTGTDTELDDWIRVTRNAFPHGIEVLKSPQRYWRGSADNVHERMRVRTTEDVSVTA